MWRISWLAANRLAFQEGFCPKEPLRNGKWSERTMRTGMRFENLGLATTTVTSCAPDKNKKLRSSHPYFYSSYFDETVNMYVTRHKNNTQCLLWSWDSAADVTCVFYIFFFILQLCALKASASLISPLLQLCWLTPSHCYAISYPIIQV